MLVLSNSPHRLQGLNSSHLKDITADVKHSNQKVNLSWRYLVSVQMLRLCSGCANCKNMTHSIDKDVAAPQTRTEF